MKLIYILDGYNVIHAIPRFKRKLDESLEAARAALLAFCAGLKASRKDIHSITVVFDGQEAGQEHAPGGVRVLFTHRGEEADERILSIIRESPSTCRFRIVSNDNFILNNCRAHSTDILSVEDFFKEFISDNSLKNKELNEKEKPDASSCEGRRITEDYKKYLDF